MVVSSAHGAIVGMRAVLAIFHHLAFRHDIFHYPIPDQLDWSFAASAGYSLHDMSIMLFHREPVSMWVHHAAMAYGCFLMPVYRQMPFFATLFQMSELTVLPTNLLWFMSKFGLKERHPNATTSLVKLRAAFYILFRVWLGPWSVYHALKLYSLRELVKKYCALPLPVSVGNAANVSFLSMMNFIWTKQALSAISRRR
jgi:hypothetical protein